MGPRAHCKVAFQDPVRLSRNSVLKHDFKYKYIILWSHLSRCRDTFWRLPEETISRDSVWCRECSVTSGSGCSLRMVCPTTQWRGRVSERGSLSGDASLILSLGVFEWQGILRLYPLQLFLWLKATAGATLTDFLILTCILQCWVSLIPNIAYKTYPWHLSWSTRYC